MNIGICITGHIRSGLNNFPNNIPIFDFIESIKRYGLNIKYYISTYNNNGHNIGLHSADNEYTDTSLLNTIENCKFLIKDDDKNNLNIENLSFKYADVFKGLEPNDPPHHIQKYNILQMFSTIKDCYNLIDDDIDIILRTRFDCTFDINTFIKRVNSLEQNTIYIPNEYEFDGEYAPGGGRINDIMALGYRNVMNVYMNTFDWLNSDECHKYMLDNNLWFCPHTILKHNLQINNISYIKENFNCKIYRKNGNIL